MEKDGYLPQKKLGKSLNVENLRYRFFRGQPLKLTVSVGLTISPLSLFSIECKKSEEPQKEGHYEDSKHGEFCFRVGPVTGSETLPFAKRSDTQKKLVRGPHCKLWTECSFFRKSFRNLQH